MNSKYYAYIKTILVITMIYLQNIHSCQNETVPTFDIVMCRGYKRPAEWLKQLQYSGLSDIKRRLETCGLHYDDTNGFIKVKIYSKTTDGRQPINHDNNPAALRKAMIAAHKKKGLPMHDPSLIRELMRPQLPVWIPATIIENLKNKDILEFFVYGIQIKATIFEE